MLRTLGSTILGAGSSEDVLGRFAKVVPGLGDPLDPGLRDTSSLNIVLFQVLLEEHVHALQGWCMTSDVDGELVFKIHGFRIGTMVK